ncbi:hypothetical protein MUY21_15695 [Aliiroseovarius sp. S2029]|uniref:hypothetical protein n=1 Tax=Aliiroseovarius sp. S2029 TaxID=2936988 RepID=UPI0020BD8D42|nr:hypothetical protein [Aliiroseovarius sp. S2029]MCK8485485.1 hypothetical protein [Aliiroseovarius sp. S2029]
MGEVNGTFVTEVDGVRYYTDGIKHQGTSFSVSVAYVDFSHEYDAISDTGGWEVGASTRNPVFNVDSEGNVRVGAEYRMFEAGVIRYADGTTGVYGGVNAGLPGLGVSYTVHGGSGGSGPYGQLSTYDHLNVYADGTVQKVEYSPGDENYNHVKVKISTLDQNGDVIGDPILTNIASVELASDMLSGHAPHIWQHESYWGDKCFSSGTPILLSDGSTSEIETLKSDDLVACFAEEENSGRAALTARPIVRLYENVTDCFVRIEYPDGRAPLHVTPGHAFLDETGRFTKIGDLLRLGGNSARLIDEDGEVITVTGTWLHYSVETAHLFERATTRSIIVDGNIAFKEYVVEGWKTYNFEVSEHHTYVAGGIRVHNTSGDFYTDPVTGHKLFDDHSTPGIVERIDITTFNQHHFTSTNPPGKGMTKVPDRHGYDWHYDQGSDVDNNGIIDERDSRHWGKKYQPGGDFNRDGNLDRKDKIAHDIDLHERHLKRAQDNGDPEDVTKHQRALDRLRGREQDLDNKGSDRGKPVILDLDGDGVEINVNGNVSFDMDGDGYLEQGAWVNQDDGFLVIDLNADGSHGDGDGKIDQTKELILSEWSTDPSVTDLQALAIFDKYEHRGGNNDGVLDAQDSIWDELRVWQDINQNGVTDTGELKSLAELGITQINLTYDDGSHYLDNNNDVTILGNTLFGSASYTRNGEVIEGGVGDVALRYNAQGWRRVETDAGYNIEFETGATLRYAVMDGSGSAGLDAYVSNLDGVQGDARDNVISATDHTRNVALSGGDGNDTLRGGYADDMLAGGEGADILEAARGNDIVFFDAADTRVDGGWGYDTAIAVGDIGVTLDLANTGFQVAHGTDADDTLVGGINVSELAVNLHGKGGDDLLKGSRADDLISGDEGNDHIEGGNGDDMLLGGAGNDTLHGHGDDDVLMGGSGDDTLEGNNGDDMLLGGSGADILNGGGQDDYLDGGEGDDTLDGGEYDDILIGGTGNDILRGGGGDDVLDGGDGNDVIYTNWGDDLVRGGAGNDTIHVERWGDKRVEAGDGNDHIHISSNGGSREILGGKGTDKIYLTGNKSEYTVKYVGNGSKGVNEYRIIKAGTQILHIQDIEAIVYGNGGYQLLAHRNANLDNSASFYLTNPAWADGAKWHGKNDWTLDKKKSLNWHLKGGDDKVVIVGSYSDTMHMEGGDDIAALGAGNDTGIGDTGNDQLYGQNGHDTLDGGSGMDGLSGGNGNDVIEGGAGADIIYGGVGNDTLKGGSGADVITGDAGDDIIEGGYGSDVLSGSDGADTIKGDDGSDRLDGGKGNDMLYGGDGSDRLKGGENDDHLYGELGDDTLQGEEGDDVLNGGRGNDVLEGGDGNDELNGSFDFDQLDGGAGNDILRGGNLDDVLIGGDGDDQLYGDADKDVLEGGAGADLLDGGNGIFDIASYASSDAGVDIDLMLGTAAGGHATGDSLVNIEWLSGSDHDDRLVGDGNDNHLYGVDGSDELRGGDGRDNIYGGNGNDSAHGDQGDDNVFGEDGDDELRGQDGNDVLSGGNGNDLLQGDNGNDRLYGDDGDDKLVGGLHSDELTGGAGADEFRFAAGDGIDVITDFGDGIDRIVFTSTGLSFAAISITDSSDGAIVSYGNTDTITLSDVLASQLTEDDFSFA